MPNKSKKGSQFERAVCVTLSMWFSQGQHSDWFWRTAGSGGRATTRTKKGKRTTNAEGDVQATCAEATPLLRFITIELKRGYSGKTLQDLIDTPETARTPEYARWFFQAEQSRKQSGAMYWAVIVRRDKRSAVIMLPKAAYDALDCDDPPGMVLQTDWWKEAVVAMDAEDFLEAVDPRSVLEAVAKGGRAQS